MSKPSKTIDMFSNIVNAEASPFEFFYYSIFLNCRLLPAAIICSSLFLDFASSLCIRADGAGSALLLNFIPRIYEVVPPVVLLPASDDAEWNLQVNYASRHQRRNYGNKFSFHDSQQR
jgi:hypothetical protein